MLHGNGIRLPHHRTGPVRKPQTRPDSSDDFLSSVNLPNSAVSESQTHQFLKSILYFS
uniref:Uncharacterized protein n=1 Tax=Kalanchoe fedtschenkoi TaxID=63787 RepID=A0A7N0ZSC3_KALFE